MKKYVQNWHANWIKSASRFIPILAVVFVFGGLGTALFLNSHAATPTVSIETEGGNVSSAVTAVSDGTASGGHAIKFGSGDTTSNCPAYPAFPDASCTGYSLGTSLTNVGNLVVNTAGTIVQNVRATGITVNAANVTIKNSLIKATSDSDNPIILNNSTGLTIQDSEIDGSGPSVCTGPGIGWGDYTLIRVNIHNTGDDAVKLGDNVTIQDSYIHDPAACDGNHGDGMQLQGGQAHVTIKHNSINMPYSCPSCNGGGYANAALFLAPDLGPNGAGPIDIEQNYLSGGGYSVYIVDGNNGQYLQRGYTFINNTFGKNSSEYGPFRCTTDEKPYTTFSGNVWDTGGSIGTIDNYC